MVIDVGGVGYKIYSSMTTLEKASLNDEFLVYTYTHIREDIFDIYGFSSVEELNTFQMLISVSGVGPRGALSIVSYMPTDKFALAVIHSDIKAITAAPGIARNLTYREKKWNLRHLPQREISTKLSMHLWYSVILLLRQKVRLLRSRIPVQLLKIL